MQFNLSPRTDETKTTITFQVYDSIGTELIHYAKKYGISKTQLLRHAVNETLQTLKGLD